MKIVISIAVIAFIAILMALLFPSSGRGPSREQSIAKNDVSTISEAASFYKNEYGTYPEGSLSEIITILRGENRNNIAFIDTESTTLTIKNGIPVDPWGRAYHIALHDLKKPHVWSSGRDGLDQAGDDHSDDITSWK